MKVAPAAALLKAHTLPCIQQAMCFPAESRVLPNSFAGDVPQGALSLFIGMTKLALFRLTALHTASCVLRTHLGESPLARLMRLPCCQPASMAVWWLTKAARVQLVRRVSASDSCKVASEHVAEFGRVPGSCTALPRQIQPVVPGRAPLSNAGSL